MEGKWFGMHFLSLKQLQGISVDLGILCEQKQECFLE